MREVEGGRKEVEVGRRRRNVENDGKEEGEGDREEK